MEKLHINFYEDNMGLDAIADSISDAKVLLTELESLRRPASSPTNNRDERTAKPLEAV